MSEVDFMVKVNSLHGYALYYEAENKTKKINIGLEQIVFTNHTIEGNRYHIEAYLGWKYMNCLKSVVKANQQE